MLHKINLLILFVLSAGLVFAQNGSQWISNDSIKYGVGLLRSEMKEDGTYSTPKFVIGIKLNEQQRSQLKLVSKEKWISLLENDKTDWAANLLLYYLYLKNAIKYESSIKTRDEWKASGQQKKDIEYWKSFLSSH